MSSYFAKFRNKETGVEVMVRCLDDYFGYYKYGYYVEGEAGVMTEDELDERFERVRDESHR